MRTKEKWIPLVIILFSSLLLTGCETVKKTNEVIAKLTETLDTTSKVDMMAYVVEGSNVNDLGETAPVSFMVIQMENDQALFTASFEDLAGDIKKVLKKDYIAHKKYTLPAGQFVHIGPFDVKKDVHYLAIVSAYKELEQKVWRATEEIDPENQHYSAHVTIGDNGIKLDVKKAKKALKGLIKE